MKFVDVKNDIAFRKIFGNENRKEALISFLNAVLLLPEEKKIIDVTILSPYQLPALKSGKVTIVDVKAKDQNGNTFIIEMQVAQVEGLNKRVLYYAAQSYSSQIERGDDYEKLNPVFFIGILDFVITKNPCHLSRHGILDVETGENIITDVEFIFIELPKFNKQQNELKSIIDQWIFFIKNAENLNVIPDTVEDKGLQIAYEGADRHNWTKEELEAYNNVFIREQDDRGKITFAYNKGIEIGLEASQKEIAKSLLQSGLSPEEVSKHVKLTVDDLRKLQAG